MKRVEELRNRSRKRRELLAKQFCLSNEGCLSSLLHSRYELKMQQDGVIKYGDKWQSIAKRFAVATIRAKEREEGRENQNDTTEEKKEGSNGLEETTVYKDSTTFLKGTQSANPHNDYCQHFLDTGQRPQNFIRDAGIADRFEEYPKLKELIRLKELKLQERATPPMYLKCDLETFDLKSLEMKFDVILVNPPLEEYQRRASGVTFSQRPWRWEEIVKLELESIASPRSFMFLWSGSAEGLNWGRDCLRKWGFRRCEDIAWIKTNFKNPGATPYMEPTAVFQHCKEHCLMGIRGTVRRSTDTDFIHSNVDIDLIITEEPAYGSTEKPAEIFSIIEHFCLGRRRLYLFGDDSTVRPGWLTLGPDLSSSNYSKETYNNYFEKTDDLVLGFHQEIDSLRPKSPPPKVKQPRQPPAQAPPVSMQPAYGMAHMNPGYPPTYHSM